MRFDLTSPLLQPVKMSSEALILDLAANLAAIKHKLVSNRLSKPLFNTELFTKHLEDGYRQTYQHYFDGKKVRSDLRNRMIVSQRGAS